MVLLSLAAVAELGGTVSSVQADQQRLNATRSVRQAQTYTVHEMRTPNQGVIHEFVTPAGKVFAVSYRGPILGESNALLGSYANQLAPALRTAHNGLHRGGPVHIELPGLTYHAIGHMRSYIVHAYLPDNIPQGVTAEELQ